MSKIRGFWRSILRFSTVTLALILLVVPAAAETQQAQSLPRLAHVVPAPPGCKISTVSEAFLQGLHDRGYVDGVTINVDRRCYSTPDQLPSILQDVIARRVNVIVAAGNIAAEAAKRATSTIPIVMVHTDPVGTGLVASLARPGGNVTGVSGTPPELAGKRLEILKQLNPRLSRVTLLFEPEIDPRARDEIETASRALRLTLQASAIRTLEDLNRAFDSVARNHPDAVVVHAGAGVITVYRQRIIDWAKEQRLPLMFNLSQTVEEGALVSYGADNHDVYRRLVSGYVDKILKGADPAGLPVEQPTRFTLLLNLKTAKAIHLAIPQSLLQSADRLVE